jgi:hypothetical protein
MIRIALFSALFVVAGCSSEGVDDTIVTDSDVTTTPIFRNDESPRPNSDCDTAPLDAPADLKTSACPDHDRDGFMVHEDCGTVLKDALPTGCVFEYRPELHDELWAAASAWDPTNGPFDDSPYLSPIDCDDTDPYTYPGAEDPPLDRIDQDCQNGDAPKVLYPDGDRDGYPLLDPEQLIGLRAPIFCYGDYLEDPYTCWSSEFGGIDRIPERDDDLDDCNDNVADIHPGAAEPPDPDIRTSLIDKNCDGRVTCFRDGDGDGVGSMEPATADGLVCEGDGVSRQSNDCDDANKDVGPQMGEIPGDGIDNNCDPDRKIDEVWTKARAFINVRALPSENISSFLAEICFAVLSEDGEEQLPFTLTVNGGPPVRFDGYDCPIGSLRYAQTTRIGTADFPGQVTFGSDAGQIVVEITADGFAYDVVGLGHIWGRASGSTSTTASASAWKRPLSRLTDDCSNASRDLWCETLPVTLDLQRETMLMRSDMPMGISAGTGPVAQLITPDGDWQLAY